MAPRPSDGWWGVRGSPEKFAGAHIKPPPLGRWHGGGRLQFARKFAGAPFSISSVDN
jgi:hypothetical protein